MSQVRWLEPRAPYVCFVCVRLLFLLSPPVLALKQGRYFQGGGWEETQSLPHFSCGTRVKHERWVSGRLVGWFGVLWC